ncbi:EF-hand domain-containing protein [Amycolatopsis sp. H20-H5]|uniref:EF-hand domain-containing protein n=1 Tax=Amycolatopsis sp. H20-H5 TaxID=3046309 RepID=UPI002DBF06A0|nr:EF-hand domain-containing protein [Amycolatopsis sp. H20-H5]MEC3978746.1 EF-hand domain-containing protein [Amycolatopsis sp. H20-H5]
MRDKEATERNFKELDSDNDGYITAAELKANLQKNPKVSAENVAKIVQLADENGDKRIDYKEYAKYLG